MRRGRGAPAERGEEARRDKCLGQVALQARDQEEREVRDCGSGQVDHQASDPGDREA